MKAFMVFKIGDYDPYKSTLYCEKTDADIACFHQNQNCENPPEFEVCLVEICLIKE